VSEIATKSRENRDPVASNERQSESPERQETPPRASIATLVSEWIATANARVRTVSELAAAEAQLAATSTASMAFMAILAAGFTLTAWGLGIAGVANALVSVGLPIWATLGLLAVIHIVAAYIAWRKAISMIVNLKFTETRRQFSSGNAPDNVAEREVRGKP